MLLSWGPVYLANYCFLVAKIRYQGAQIIFWDLGGQVRMRSMWEKYYMEANTVVFVVDSADVGRLDEAKIAFGTSSLNPLR